MKIQNPIIQFGIDSSVGTLRTRNNLQTGTRFNIGAWNLSEICDLCFGIYAVLIRI
jgi:hypothetical protein